MPVPAGQCSLPTHSTSFRLVCGPQPVELLTSIMDPGSTRTHQKNASRVQPAPSSAMYAFVPRLTCWYTCNTTTTCACVPYSGADDRS